MIIHQCSVSLALWIAMIGLQYDIGAHCLYIFGSCECQVPEELVISVPDHVAIISPVTVWNHVSYIYAMLKLVMSPFNDTDVAIAILMMFRCTVSAAGPGVITMATITQHDWLMSSVNLCLHLPVSV